MSECESFFPRQVKAVNLPAIISSQRPLRSSEALSTKTSCSLIPLGDSFRLCRALFIGPWLSLVERLVRDEEAASSNLAGPTISLPRAACSPARFERCERSATANPANLNEELLNACSLGGAVPICRAPWNALMAGGPQTSAK